jgi:hypothetical protein
MIQIKIDNHLLIPFGREKWRIEDVRLAGVSTEATCFESKTPLVYINKALKRPLTLGSVGRCFPKGTFPEFKSHPEAFDHVQEHLKTRCQVGTEYEKRFLDVYFEYVRKECEPLPEDYPWQITMNKRPPKSDVWWLFQALLPLPQAHLYHQNPLSETYSFVPERMVKVDFAFWTGEELIAVEIDGSSHIGSANHVTKDRALLRAGVHLIHILNNEVMEYGTKIITRLFPKSVVCPWEGVDVPPWTSLDIHHDYGESDISF